MSYKDSIAQISKMRTTSDAGKLEVKKIISALCGEELKYDFRSRDSNVMDITKSLARDMETSVRLWMVLCSLMRM